MSKITKISNKGLSLIKEYEGFRSKPYLCPAGVPTIGYGSTRYLDGTKVTLKDLPLTEEGASVLLLDTLSSYERAVDSLCTDELTQNQFDALVSFTYNLGEASLRSSKLLSMVNNNHNNPAIRDELVKWIYSKGKVLDGLKRRREAEAKLYFDES